MEVENDAIADNEEWRCNICTLINPPHAEYCMACENNRIQLVHDIEEHVPYQELVDLSSDALVSNPHSFECEICLESIRPGKGIILKSCLHTFCRDCLAQAIALSTEPEVQCPFNAEHNCEYKIQQCELVTEDIFQKYLARGLSIAEAQMPNTRHCKTYNCPGWVIYEGATNEFTCPVCNHRNCLNCDAVHDTLDCETYQISLNKDLSEDVSRTLVQSMVSSGTAMKCPTCGVVIHKIAGCDGLQCSSCRTHLCWATKNRRWGPMGIGDTSGGCRCNVNGMKCHPSCRNCH